MDHQKGKRKMKRDDTETPVEEAGEIKTAKTIFDFAEATEEHPYVYGIRIKKDVTRHCDSTIVFSCTCYKVDTMTKFCSNCGKKCKMDIVHTLRKRNESDSAKPFRIIEEWNNTLFIFHPEDKIQFTGDLDAVTMAEKAKYYQTLVDREKELGALLLLCKETILTDMDDLYKRPYAKPLVKTCPTDGLFDVSHTRFSD